MAGHTAESLARYLGQAAEDKALRFLKKHGLTLVKKNYRCRMGEIDLLMRDRDCLVVVEVRYRKNNRFASAANSVDRHKQGRLVKTVALFLAQHQEYSGFSVRFDVIAFNQVQDVNCKLQWIKDAFRPE